MQKTEWRTLFNPSKDIRALQISHWEAIDIGYECPKCGSQRAAIWMFPDEPMVYTDECCNQPVLFEPKTGSEEE